MGAPNLAMESKIGIGQICKLLLNSNLWAKQNRNSYLAKLEKLSEAVMIGLRKMLTV